MSLKQQLFRFGAYTLDPSRMSLRKGEKAVRLAPKAFDTLAVLVQHRGEVVTKQHLMDAVWSGTYVEEGNLAQNVFLLRKKLGQTDDGGEYIETLPKRGYRMSVPVYEIEGYVEERQATEPKRENGKAVREEPAWKTEPTVTRSYRAALMGALFITAIAFTVLFARRMQPNSRSAPAVADFIQITYDTNDKRGRTGALGGPDAALLTDGSRLYFTSGTSTAPSIWQVSVSGGEPARIEVPFVFPQLLDFSTARSELLLAGSMDDVTLKPLWSAPMPGGAPHRLGDITARDGSWSPDGHQIAFTGGTGLYLSSQNGSGVRKLADLPGIGWRPRWSPDGKLLRLTIANVETNSQYLWEVSVNGSHGSAR